MFTQCLVLFVLSTVTVTFANNDDPTFNRFRGHVLKTNGKYEVVTGLASSYKEPDAITDDILATGLWDQTYNQTGWSVLEIKTFANQTNIEQAYAAGVLEGQLTRELTKYQWLNNINSVCPGQPDFCSKLRQFLNIQLDWVYAQIDNYPNEEYWHQINLLLVQLNGLIDGHEDNQRGPRKELDDPLGFFLFQIIESTGELAERLGFPEVEQRDSCSALIKLLPNNTDVYVSHADWSHYNSMLKVIKRYTMPLKRSAAADSVPIAATDTIFSSYPGTLHSIDDFYMTKPADLTIIETTINNHNPDLFHNIIPISVPEWMRVVVANRLANTGQEWVDKFFLFNDGTYNNEWMITDYKQFTPGTLPKPGFLTVTEQMVTYSKSQDMTDTLNNKTYWASYNNVYFPEFREISHEDQFARDNGTELYSWDKSSRARIFARDQHKVVDLTTMMHMMRYNDFENDELSRCNCTPPYSAELTIASRCDRNLVNGTYPNPLLKHRPNGATDAKIVSHAMMQTFSLVATAGPTTENQPPFIWSQSDFDKQVSHIAHPDVWNFTSFSPTWTLP